MKDKIIAKIKSKFSDLNLSAKRIDAIAARLAPKIKDEAEIDAKLDELNDLVPFADIAKDDDKLASYKSKLKATGQQDPTKEKEKTQAEKDAEAAKAAAESTKSKTDDTPEWAKALLASNQALAEKVTKLEGDKSAQTIRQTLAEKLKAVPENFWGKRQMPSDEDSIDDFVTEASNDWTALEKERTDKGLGNMGRPAGSGGGGGNNEKASQAEIDAVVKSLPM